MKKILLGMGSIAAVAAPIAGVISCGPSSGKIDKTIAFITDGGDINDKSFNQSVYEGAKDARGQIAVGKPASAGDIEAAYANAKTHGAKIIVAAGFNHGTPLVQYAKAHTEMKFIWIDGDANLPNVASIKFNMKKISFIAGIRMADYVSHLTGTHHKIGVYGGLGIPSVNAYLNGVKEGVKFYNAHKPNAITTDIVVEDAGFVGGFGTGGQSATLANKLVKNNNDLILSVGGPQYQDVLQSIKSASSTAKLVGVDVNIKGVVSEGDKKYVWGSILKNLRSVTHTITASPTAHYGQLYMGTMENKGTGLWVKDSEVTLDNKFGILDSMTDQTAAQVIDAAKLLT